MQSEIRLKKRRDFKRVYTYGKSVANRELVLYVMNNPRVKNVRIGISVSKKIGNAVVRNRVKRLIKESTRTLLEEIPLKEHKDLIFICRAATARMDFEQMKKSVKDILLKSKLIEKN